MKRAKPLADLLPPVLGPALAAQGFTGADVVASWPEIVGERLAARSRPLKVAWPRRHPGDDAREPATLFLRVEGAFALEIQHLAPTIIERINAVYGWRCIGRLVLKQGPVAHPQPKRTAAADPPPTERARVTRAVAAVEADGLRDALERLGCAIVAEAAVATATPCHAGADALAHRAS